MRVTRILFSVFLFLTSSLFFAEADPCNRNFGNCARRNGMCWGTGTNTHFCGCEAGYRAVVVNGRQTCEDINECRDDNPCDENAYCENLQGSYECHCVCGYVKDYTGQRCLDASRIRGNCYTPRSCYHPIWWWFGDTEFRTIYGDFGFLTNKTSGRVLVSPPETPTSSCARGFEHNECGYCTDIDECRTGTHTCTSRHQTCTNTEGSFYCGCNDGYILGPCRTRCYAARARIPLICDRPDLSKLDTSGSAFSGNPSFNRPFLLRSYRTCLDSAEAGDETTERFDLDGDGTNDIILTWLCESKTLDRNNRPVSRSGLRVFQEREASWDQWTSWTVCKATCWGGLQTRIRECRNGLPGIEGCKGEASQKRECYSGRKCDFRVRKDATTLTTAERNDLIQAMEKYKADMTEKGFHNAAGAHGWPQQCDRESCCPHGAKMKFLTWHRSIVLNFEEGLVRHLNNKRLGIPYWNWLATDRNPPDLVWRRTINGRPNPFASMTILIDRTGPGRGINRDDNVAMNSLDFAHNTWRDVAKNLIKPHTMHAFSESLESAHGGPHVSICGGGRMSARCTQSMASLAFAAFDPLFMFHHSQVDRLWAVAQKQVEDKGETAWTIQTALEVFEDEGDYGRKFQPFANKSINSFPIVQATNTMHDAYYYRELTGITYDELGNDGFPVVPSDSGLVGERVLRLATREALFVSHYFQSVPENVYINYYFDFDPPGRPTPCSRTSANDFVAGTLLLGTTNNYRNTIPNLSLMENLVGSNRIDLDFKIKACYTRTPNCTENCPEIRAGEIPRLDAMPDPGMVYYFHGQPSDMYKFFWETGRKYPNWQINLEGSSQWILFYGPGAANVRQVGTYGDWQNCRYARARQVNCHLEGGGACVLPLGIYYFIDADAGNCRNGQRMIITSRA